MRSTRWFLVLVLAGALPACGGGGGDDVVADAAGDGDGDGDGDGAVPTIDAADPADGAGPCNTLTQLGAPVQTMQVAQAMPTPTGGAIPTGTWVRTALSVYTGSGGPAGPIGPTIRATGRFGGGNTLDMVIRAGAASDQFLSMTYIAGDPDITMTVTCPDGANSFIDAYTVVDATTVLLFSSSNNSVETIELQ